MEENGNAISLELESAPTLTLEQAAPSAPSLVLGEQKEEEKPQAAPVTLKDMEEQLTEAERQVVNEFAEKIDISDSAQVMTYGSAAQQKVAGFSEEALNSIKTKDLGAMGQDLAALTVQLKNMGQKEKTGIAGWFQKKKNEIESLKAEYAKAEVNVDKIVEKLEEHQVTLMKDIAMFDKMYELNLNYYKELTMYILAGKKKLEETRNTTLVELKKKAEETGAQEDAQKYNDMVSLCDRFEKKLHDLELTRMISVQMGPQTRLLQNNDTLMVEKIQSSIVNTIPLWKSQMVLALGIEHGRQATAAQNAVTEMTNKMLKENSEKLKIATVETAKEAERSIVDIETLKTTNANLINTLDEVMRIHEEGRVKRKAAEEELGKLEGELKNKLLELKK